MLKVVHEENQSQQHAQGAIGGSLLDELARDGARQMLAAALTAEVAAYVDSHRHVVAENGHRLVIRNGFHDPREIATVAGAVPVRQPRANDKRIDEATGERKRFSSAILPAWASQSPGLAEVLPLLCLHGLSSGDFVPALEQFLGSAAGLSAATVTRLTTQWQDDARSLGERSLQDSDYVCLWVDGIHLKVRLEQDKVRLLVMIGVRVDSTKGLVTLADGLREPSESWAVLLRDCRRRGMRAPVPAVADRALGFWKALLGNVLAALPRSTAHPGAKAALAATYNAQDKEHAIAAAKAVAADCGAKWPKAVAKVTDDLDVLLAFYDYPAEHWIHLRTTNPIESTFATVRLRQRVAKGPDSRAAGVAMTFKLIESAQRLWRAVNSPHLVALVRAGATFENGVLAERPDTSASERVA